VFDLIDRTPKVPSILHANSRGLVPSRAPREAGVPRVAFEAVTFAYDSRPDAPVLDKLTLRVPDGATVALVGPSGAGKSTVVGLLMRFYDPTGGSVLIDGLDLRRVDARWLRRQMALVSQEPVLFACSVADNIAYGARARAASDGADAMEAATSVAQRASVAAAAAEEDALALRGAVEAAARQANAHEFIERFQDGYETLVGERGVRLSGGQKQRVAIARALLHDPPLLLLDEATSALDAESEALVQAALERLVEHRTTLVIAHRLSTVVNADSIVVLAERRVAGEGRHEDLLKTCPEYAALVRRQLHSAAAANSRRAEGMAEEAPEEAPVQAQAAPGNVVAPEGAPADSA